MSSSSRLRILSVGGNAVSAFLSWRLQATNACDVTLVWKSGFDNVSQYGISFKSSLYGNERFKPRAVVRSPEEVAGPPGFDYVLLCVKALPDVYDLAAVIESVVTPQLTCIIVNTTNSLGVEPYLESRFPTNVVLSLCSGVNIVQLGASEFEHVDYSDVWVGSANLNPNIPPSVQGDMAEALALTLQSGNVNCQVSPNIRQQQWEKLMGPIAFHPLSVLTETANHQELYEKPGMKVLVDDLLDELLHIATAQGCSFEADFKQKTTNQILSNSLTQSTMYQDFQARRPMEVEIFLGSPLKMAQELGFQSPRVQTLYPLLFNVNLLNQTKQPSPPPSAVPLTQAHLNLYQNGAQSVPPRFPSNGHPAPDGRRLNGMGGPPGGRRMPPVSLRNPHNGGGQPGQQFGRTSRRNSFDNDLEEFGHIAMYGDMVHTDDNDDLVVGSGNDRSMFGGDMQHNNRMPPDALAMKERELQLRQRELAIREQEIAMQQQGRAGRRRSNQRQMMDDDDDDDDDDFAPQGPPGPPIDPDNIDMMSVTSRRNRRTPNAASLKSNPHPERPVPSSSRSSYGIFGGKGRNNKERASSRLISEIPSLHQQITDDPLMAYSSNRYGVVDRKALADNSRANSMTGHHMQDARPDFHGHGGPGLGPGPRRASLNPVESRLNNQRPPMPGPFPSAPGNGPYPPMSGGRPPMPSNIPQNMSNQGGVTTLRQPQPKYPNGHVISHVEQQAQNGVSQNLFKGSNNAIRSLTGSASASADSGSSGLSGSNEFDHSAYNSSSSSVERRNPGLAVGVRV